MISMSDTETPEPLSQLDDLYRRHPGVTESLGRAYFEAASVCLSRHHLSPTDLTVSLGYLTSRRSIRWALPDQRTLRAWNNANDATRDGAYAVSLAAVEAELSLVAVSRAETQTGADYYLGPLGAEVDLETAFRLEVSGSDSGDPSRIRSRLRQKVTQLKLGHSNKPAFAVVVGFAHTIVAIESVPGD